MVYRSEFDSLVTISVTAAMEMRIIGKRPE